MTARLAAAMLPTPPHLVICLSPSPRWIAGRWYPTRPLTHSPTHPLAARCPPNLRSALCSPRHVSDFFLSHFDIGTYSSPLTHLRV